MRCRFSFYQRSSTSGTYHIHPSLGYTNWRPSSSILGAVELIPDMEDTIGCYILHKDSKKQLDKMGYVCRWDFRDNEPGIASHTVEDQPENPLLDDFYKIDSVLERRLSKDTLTRECCVRCWCCPGTSGKEKKNDSSRRQRQEKAKQREKRVNLIPKAQNRGTGKKEGTERKVRGKCIVLHYHVGKMRALLRNHRQRKSPAHLLQMSNAT